MNAQTSLRSEVYRVQQAPAVRLRTFALGALAACMGANGGTLEDDYLLGQLEAAAPGHGDWLAALPGYLERPHLEDAPLLSLARELNLMLIELLAVALAAAVEDDAMIGRALAYYQAPVGGSRPTLALLAMAFASTVPTGVNPIDALMTGAALNSGVIRLQGEGKPLPEQALMIPLPIRLALSGYDSTWPDTTLGLASGEMIPLPESMAQAAERHARALALSAQSTLVIRCGQMVEGRSAAAVVAGALGCRPLFIETDKIAELGPWLFLRRLLPVFCAEFAPGERKILLPIPYYRGPVLVVCGPEGSVETRVGTALNWALPIPSRAEREQLWSGALGNGELAGELARVHRHSSGRIAHLSRLARHYSVVNGNDVPTLDDVIEAARSGEGAGLDALAQPLRDAIPDDALVIPDEVRRELENLLLRCRARDELAHGLGVSATTRYFPGVRALLVGPSGTGKTLAAGWLATRLGLPLYRVDLASVTSKYIGETEKNLAQLLARAERSEVVLLFDEADALFAKRTDVKEANDRFANTQTNYLLQRIESFDGITLLTSNNRTRFDTAFSRRLDMIIEFPLPGPEERRQLWQAHLGQHHRLSQKVFNQLAATVDLGGGHIRNAVLAAAVPARAHNRPIEYADILDALASEYKKLGRQMPVELRESR